MSFARELVSNRDSALEKMSDSGFKLSMSFDQAREQEVHEHHQNKIETQLALGIGVLAGNIDTDEVSTITAKQYATSKQNKDSDKEKRKQAGNDTFMLDMLEQIRDHVQSLENYFQNKYKDAWREILANKILDEVPQQMDGESIQEYRERIEKLLIKEMLDENGNIKAEYANHSDEDIRKTAEWAHNQNLLNNDQKSLVEYIQDKKCHTSSENLNQCSLTNNTPSFNPFG